MPSVVPITLSLGNRGLYESLLGDVFRRGGWHRKEDVHAYCRAIRYRVGAQLDGALQLLLNIGILVREGDLLCAAEDILWTSKRENIGLTICGRLLDRLATNGEIEHYLPPGCVTWGTVEGEMNLHLSKIPMAALPVIKLLRDLGVVADSGQATVLLKVLEPFATNLRDAIVVGARLRQRKGSLTPERLAEMRVEHDKQGAEAENFVLGLETRRLQGHPQLELVRRVSLIDASAGYDIESFEGPRSFMPDRFIEVKSYGANERFFISIGEINAAKDLGERYFLYIVDMRMLGSRDYHPTIIQNPAAWLSDPSLDWSVIPVKFEVIRQEEPTAHL